MSIRDIFVRPEDKLDDVEIEQISVNWYLPVEESLPISQRIMLHVLEKLKELEDRITTLETLPLSDPKS